MMVANLALSQVSIGVNIRADYLIPTARTV